MNVPKLCMAVAAAICAVSAPVVAAPVTISGDPQKPVVIVCSQKPQSREMGDYLRKFLTDRGFAVKPGLARAYRKDYRGPQWILATQSTLKSLKTDVKAPKFAANARDEAYLLQARAGASGPVVVLVGKTDAGLRSAVARLISTIANDGRKLATEARREVNDPLVKYRGIIMGDSGRRQCPEGSPFKDIDFEVWQTERIKAYPELFRQFGFNCVQIAENRGYGSISGPRLKQAQDAILAFAKSAKARHLMVSLDAWGDCPYVEGESYCWNDPAERKKLISYIEEIGRLYGPHIDHFNIHIGDPGGCTRNGCDPSYKTSQQINTEYLRVFRKYNPKVMGAMSTWCNSRFWLHSPKPVDLSNYREYFHVREPRFGAPMPDRAKFLDETFMPRSMGIALHQSYNDDQATMLTKAGRPVDIWAWYIGDMEMVNNLYIAMGRVDEAYSKLPASAREKLRLGTVEITFHGWPQIINHYCAAQKMWNPKRKIQDIEREFCVAAFGPQNADAALALYQACENGVLHDIPQPAEFGTAAYNEKLAAVLDRSESIIFPEGWKPNFAFPVPVEKFINMLAVRLELTLAVSEAKFKVDALRRQRVSEEKIAELKTQAIKALESIPNASIDPIYKQDAAVIVQQFKTKTFAERIAEL